MLSYEEFSGKVEIILGYSPGEDISIQWNTGGISGGSPWGEPTTSVEGEPEPEFESLDKVLEKASPQITYLQYKRLMREVVKVESTDYSDYYGNSDYGYRKSVSIQKLYEFLLSNGILNDMEDVIKEAPKTKRGKKKAG